MQILEARDFDLADTFDSGQCFRYSFADGWFTVAAGRRKLRISQTGNFLKLDCAAEELPFWENYFSLDFDYAAAKKILCRDPVMREAIGYCGGIHLLRQDLFETLICFIVSQNNNIPRIKKIVAALCDEIGGGEFPTARQMSEAPDSAYERLRAGFRVKYLRDAARKVDSGEVDLEGLRGADYERAMTELKTINGVGDKVAACVLLFAGGFWDSFPVDTWVRKACAKLYSGGFDKSIFCGYAGLAQQYLFHYARKTRLALD